MTLAELLKQEGHQQGMQQGIQQGRQEEKAAIAGKLLGQGLDLALIQSITGLSDKAIQKVVHSQH